MTLCAIFIDTNVILHFQAIDQIDWRTVSGCGECKVVIAPVLFRELEHQKIFNRSATLRGRAEKAIDLLVKKMALPDPIILRPGVRLVFVDHEPAIDFAVNRLVREIQDDHYIASALEYAHESGDPTLIASNDGGMALKLRARPVGVLRLPDDLKLPAELDPDQKELRDAKLTIARLRAQKPKLSIQFPDGSTHRVISNARALVSNAASLDQIRIKHPLIPVATDQDESLGGGLAPRRGLRAIYGLGSEAGVERYNAALTQYYANYDRYLREMAAWLERLRLTAHVELELVNDGSATATNVDVELRFPPSVSILRQRDWPKQPQAPKPPQRLGGIDAMFAEGRGAVFPHLQSPQLNIHDGAIYVDEDARTVEFSAKSLKQKCVLRADRFLLTRGANLIDRGIEIEASVTFNEGEPVAQKLSIAFREVDALSSDD